MWRKILQLVGGIAIAAVGLWIFFRDIDINKLWGIMSHANPIALIGVALLTMLSLWLRGIRWGLLLPDSKGTSKKGLFKISTIGFMVNNILPARMGEIVRAFMIWRNNKFTVAESIGSLVLERIIDGFAFLSFFFIPVFLEKKLSSVMPYALFFASMFTLAVISFVLYAFFPSAIKKIIGRILHVVPSKMHDKISRIVNELLSNLDWVFHPRKVLGVILFSYLTVLCYPFMLLLLVRQFTSFTFLDGMFGQAFAAFGAAIPLAPGYVGTLHAALLRGLSMIGTPIDIAGAVTIMYHAIAYIIVTAVGLIFFFSTKISFKDIGQAKKDMAKEEKADVKAEIE